jgi:hypothetical protein
VIFTLNVVACSWPVLCVVDDCTGLLPISVTCPLKVRSGTASMVIFAVCPRLTSGMLRLVDSTSASSTDMSATVSSTSAGVCSSCP